MPDDLSQRFYDLFRGLERSYGRYQPKSDVPAGSKNQGRAWTVHEPLTVELFRQHLAGDIGIGVTPVNENGLCRWGAIDVDDYSIDLQEMRQRVAGVGLPLIIARTKSGGAHLFLFLTEPTPADGVRKSLASWARALGRDGSEIFPKQDSVEGDGFGSWLNLPYQGGERSLRYALDAESGDALGPAEFLDVAYERAITEVEMLSVEPRRYEPVAADDADAPEYDSAAALGDDPVHPGAPPCLVKLLRDGLRPGTRNEFLFNYTLYQKRLEQPGASDRALAFAQGLIPPVNDKEARDTIKSALKRPYIYRCRNPPLVDACDRATCLKRKHGIGERGRSKDESIARGHIEFGLLCKILTTPPTWVWDVNGARIELTTEQIMNQRLFLARLLEETNVLQTPLRTPAWNAEVARAALTARQLPIPAEGTEVGVFWVHLARFCTSRAQARSLDELLLGKPFTKDGRTFFCATDFLAYCHQQKIGATEKKMVVWLHDRGLEYGEMELKGKKVSVWSVPEFTTQTAPFETPRDPEAGASF